MARRTVLMDRVVSVPIQIQDRIPKSPAVTKKDLTAAACAPTILCNGCRPDCADHGPHSPDQHVSVADGPGLCHSRGALADTASSDLQGRISRDCGEPRCKPA